MKRSLVLAFLVAGVGGLGFFLWHAHALQTFKKEFYRTEKSDRRALFEQYYGTLSAHEMATAIESLYPVCHAQAHDLGKTIYAQTQNIEKSFRQCSKACTDGCFHGVLMEALGANNTASVGQERHISIVELTDRVADICAMASNQRPGNCAHGIGHAFAYLADYHPEIALPLCEAFPTTPLKYYCAGGAYMELDLNKYALACDETLPYPVACWRYKAHSFLENTATLNEATQKCLTLTGIARRGCFHGLGFSNIDRIESHPDLLPSVCSAGSYDDRIVCIEGAIEKLADAHESRATSACGHLITELKPACERAAREKLYDLEKPFERYLQAD